MRTSFALQQTRSKLQWDRKKSELLREKQELIASVGCPDGPEMMKTPGDSRPPSLPLQLTSSRVVRRSLSVPVDLPEVANSFMKVLDEAVLEGDDDGERTHPDGMEGNAGEYKAFLPLARMDSQKSTTSDEEYFLPFDEDIDATTASQRSPQSDILDGASLQKTPADHELKQQEGGKLNPDQEREAVVLASLEEFFLGSVLSSSAETSASTYTDSSPVSTIDFDAATAPRGNVASTTLMGKNIVGLSLGRATAQEEHNHSLSGGGSTCSNGFIRRQESLSSVLEEGPASLQVKSPPSSSYRERGFQKLSMADRTTSLPLELNNSFSNRTLTRRSSLKKISSYGKFPLKPSNNNSNDDNNSTASAQSSLKRNVSFGNMQIREYNIALSDHPSCSYGPPIQLSWDYQEKEVVPVAEYDEDRTRRGRRGGHELLLSFYERHFMLIKQAGYSKREIKETMKEVERVKRERMVTDLFLPASPLDETMENIVDKVKKYFDIFGGRNGNGRENTRRQDYDCDQQQQSM